MTTDAAPLLRSLIDMTNSSDLLIGLALALSGCVVLYGMCQGFYIAHTASKWPSAKGTITKSETKPRYIRHKRVLTAEIEYQFNTGGDSFTGSIVRQMQPECDDGLALEVVKKYPVGKAVEVRYNPSRPNICVLELGVYGLTYYFIPIPIIFISAGLWLVFK